MRTNSHSEPFRVMRSKYYPITSDTSHNVKYFDYLDDAQAFYLQRVLDQVFETRMLEYVSLERFNENDKRYYPIWESFQRHTRESYGLDPNKE